MANLLWFEIRNRLFRLSSAVHFATFFSLTFLVAVALAGAFKGFNFSLGLSSKLPLNSPVVLSILICSMSYFGLLIIAPLFGQSINQDYETGFCQILFSTPIRKGTYFLIRFLGSFLSSLALLSSIGLGLWAATLMPFIDSSQLLENRIFFYLWPFFTFLIPNIFIFGAIFIAIAAATKKMAPVYVASIVLFSGYMISQNITGDLENKFAAALLEPFGMEGAAQVIRYWTVAEQNAKTIPLEGNFLYNRLLWVGIGMLALFISYLRFNPFLQPKSKKKETSDKAPVVLAVREIEADPGSWKIFWQMAVSEFRQAFSNVYFLVILFCGILYMFAVSSQIGKLYGTETLPVTYHVLEIIGETFSFFVVIILSYYAGELVWKDREQKVFEIIDSKPVGDRFFCLSKLLSLFFLQVFLLSVICLCCVLIQAMKGYFHFEWGLYGKHLFLFTLPAWMLASVLALFLHTVAKSKQVGHTLFVTVYLLTAWMPAFGFDHQLYLAGVLPRPVYSDMNGFGPIAQQYTTVFFYWASLYLFFLVLTLLLWRRGEILAWKGRLAELRIRIKPVHKLLSASSVFSWACLGCLIFYNTNVLNSYKTKRAATQELADFEVQFKRFEKMAHPKLSAVSVTIELFPENQRIEAEGRFKYQNRTQEPIAQIFVNVPEESQTTQISWDRLATLGEYQPKLGVRVYQLESPLLPGEEIQMSFDLVFQPKGFTNQGFCQKVVANGTFFHGAQYFPRVGYDSNNEISENNTRKKYGFSEKLRMPDFDDPDAIQNNYLTSEGDWIDFEATIGTSSDQIALAPGTLVREWKENRRNYFTYKTRKPILPFYAFLSGRYQVARDQWNDVQIEIYHHPEHTRNIARMIQAVKKSLDYYTANFSPYQFKELRIVEFPRYASFAQSFPTTIPYSESVGFIAKVNPDDPEDIDYPFYVTAHEVAHQWWGHQVIGGNVQGATMLSESLAQYSALMVMEKECGPHQMKKFLKYELDRYLHGRGSESEKERPLALNENQQYIHYEKGSLAFYALKDMFGEEAVNAILHDYIRDVSFQQPPFTKAIDLVQRFKDRLPSSEHLLEDLFETITLYANRTNQVLCRPSPNSGYQVEVQATLSKWRADSSGCEQEIPFSDSIDIGVFDEQGNLKYLQKHPVQSGLNKILVEVDFKPSKAGIDPLNKLIDKITEDKVVRVSME